MLAEQIENAEPAHWDNLVRSMTIRRRLIPVIGDAVLTIREPDGISRPACLWLAERVAAELGLPGPVISLTDTALEAARQLGQSSHDIRDLVLKHHYKLVQELADGRLELGETTRLLARISDFPVVITTATHDVLRWALARERDVDAVFLGDGECPDLPETLQSGKSEEPQKLVHLFGRVSPTAPFPVSLEDILERLWDLRGSPPAKLLNELSAKNLLFIGNCFPDWLAGMFIRSMRRDRLSKDADTMKALSAADLDRNGQLVFFLQALRNKTCVFEPGDVAAFVEELHARWSQRKTQDGQDSSRSVPTQSIPPAGEPPTVEDPGVFVSFCNEDRSIAEAVVRQLRQKGLDPWYDDGQIDAGHNIAQRIEQGIEKCSLFVALISRHTESAFERTFIREWRQAEKRGRDRARLRFVIPIIVDEMELHQLSTFREIFGRELHVEKAPGGILAPDLLESLKQELRAIRGLRVLEKQ